VGFRDQGLASRERAEALEREVARLEAENASLRERIEASGARPSRKSALERAAVPLGLVALALLVGAALVPLPPMGRMAFVLLASLTGCGALGAKAIGGLVLIVHPSELLVLSGRVQRADDGSQRGYRVVTGGRVVRLPIVERAEWMKVGPFPFSLELREAYARSGPVRLSARGSVEIDTRPELVGNAVERFLGRGKKELVEVARQTVEGALRAVVAELSIDRLRGDSIDVASALQRHLEADLQRLGLSLDTFVIEEVVASEGARQRATSTGQ